jgi:exodeoxyribonuclease V alpha subunit
MGDNMTYIKGNYRKTIFRSDKGYVIGLFKIRETTDPLLEDYVNKTITFTGYFHELNEDDIYIMYGDFTSHERYGEQYQVKEYERIKPEDKDGIIAFLASDLFPGIGDKMARMIVDILGDDALDKILKDPSCLLMIPKLSEEKIKNVYNILTKYEESHQMFVYLGELGFNMKDALNIYNTYRNNTMNIIENNIYQVIIDVSDIYFNKIDEIALKLNYSKDDHRRIKALIIYVMQELTFSNGDTYLFIEEINNKIVTYLKEDINLEDYINELVSDKLILIEDTKYYLKDMYDAEVRVANKVKILNHVEDINESKIDKLIKEHEYNDKQKLAIKKSLSNNLLIITGGPGTGKTTIIKEIINLYQEINHLKIEQVIEDIALLAPTGRASKRMSEATYLKASTIHRFLKWNKDSNEFLVNENNKATNKLIIVDEVSMVDLNLMDSLFKGISDYAKVILVGDYNQLPSVGPGQILKDFIESDLVETISLEHLYRQDDNSYIPLLAQEIKDNDLSDYLETKSDYTFLRCNANGIIDSLKKVANQIKDKNYDYKQVQVMAPMYASYNGIDNLNKVLQEVFNPPLESKKEIKSGDIVYRENDKVIQLVNMPDENVFNGDIGVIKRILKNEIYVDYDGVLVKYLPKDYNKIKHAFIISIHKSQGSEFDVVVMPISHSYQRMLYRKLIYTGITRAKKKLIIIGEAEAFLSGVSNNNEYIRKSTLLDRLLSIYR